MFKRIQKIFLLKNTKNYLENRTTRNINDSLTTIGFLVNEEVNIDFEKFFEIPNANSSLSILSDTKAPSTERCLVE